MQFGETALIKASQKGFNVEIVKLLLAAGAEKEAIDAVIMFKPESRQILNFLLLPFSLIIKRI